MQSKGIGQFLFTKFFADGKKVYGTFNTTPVQKEFDRYFYKVDIRNINEVKDFVGSIKNLHRVVLINCAGIIYNSFAHKADLFRWKEVIDINLIGTFNVIYSLLPIMRKEKYGRIINFSSVVAKMPTQGVSAYAASKAALIGLTKTLSIENASMGITVNSINLGYTNAGMGITDIPLINKKDIIEKIPKKRFCEPIEIYKTIHYIINTEYLTGSIIDLNGGLF
ncbi:3-oxoacyl-[acyl-carrier-protein] reductase FabG [termite gut metagenome]|uniref:3-oxoacyl-[acyl-carrier-protein] reductase FabG n=1 Tax=termite gut metagenome TaxID=433724 RepID=A0A5J4RY72_9ZZZZ